MSVIPLNVKNKCVCSSGIDRHSYPGNDSVLKSIATLSVDQHDAAC